MRQPFVPAPRGDDREARGARPVDEIADERRLVAVRQAVDHSRCRGALRQQRAAEGICLHGDHHHMLAVLERGERVLDRGDRIPRGFDDDVDPGMREERAPVVAEVRGVVLERRIERRRREHRGLPAHALEVLFGILWREIGDAHEMDARRLRHLREIHGRELTRADQTEAQRVVFSLLQLCVEVHGLAE